MKSISILLGATLALSASAQGPVNLSLKEAMDRAAQYNYVVQNSTLEAEKAAKRIKETLAIGLPQIDASGSLNNYLDVPTQVIPNFFGEGPALLPVQFGLPWNASGTIQLTQLIFNGSYLIGVQATKKLQLQSNEQLEQNVTAARVAAAKAYYGALAAMEGRRLLGESVPVLEKSVNESSAMQEAGFMENTDVDRLRIELTNLQDQVTVFERQEQLARNYLLFILGFPSGTPIQLTDNLDVLLADPNETALAGTPLDLATHIDHQLATTVMGIQELSLKNEKSAYWPSVNGFISHSQQAYSEEFDFFGSNGSWYPATLWGVSVSVPVFSSGKRHYKVAQEEIALKQTQVNLTATDERLRLEFEQRRSDAQTAEQLFTSQKDRLELQKRVFERTSVKFTNGVASSFELTQEQNNYLQAQQDYIQRVVNLVQARTELRKALDLY
jgi:outer membrane protein